MFHLKIIAPENVDPPLELHGKHALAHVRYEQRHFQKLARVAPDPGFIQIWGEGGRRGAGG